MKKIMGVMGLLVLGSALMSAPKIENKGGDEMLSPGRYTATIKAFVCGGCGEWVESKLKAVKSLDNVSADQKTRVLHFSVKSGAKVKLADIQSVLDSAAKEMGMGADYSLGGIKRENKKTLK